MLRSYRWIIALTAALTVVFALSGWAERGLGDAPVPRELLLIAANTVPLLAIRRNPLAVVLFFSVAYPLWVGLDHPTHELQSLPTLVAMYALGGWDRHLGVRAIGLLTPLWMVGAAAFGLWDVDPLGLSYVGLMFVVVWGLGAVVAGRRAYALELEARTAELEQARQELAERAVAGERARIARELHDVVAHAMSLITVQAGVGRHLIDQRPDHAASALEVIERTGRETLTEMRRMLAVLREPDPSGPVPEPQPGLADLPGLVARTCNAGGRFTLTTRGRARGTSPGLELAVYRIVQEALTNALKHAPDRLGSVTVTFGDEVIEVTVTNAPAAGRHPTEPLRRGHGLRGMAERVALYGGELETTDDDHGFRVLARLPLVGTSSDEGRSHEPRSGIDAREGSR